MYVCMYVYVWFLGCGSVSERAGKSRKKKLFCVAA